MIDAERMLGSLVRSALSGGRGGNRRGTRRRRRGRGGRGIGRSLLGAGGKGALAMGALGVAIAAFEHLSKDKGTASKFDAHPPPPPPPPAPGATTTAGPPPPPPPPPLPTAAPAARTDPHTANPDALLLVRAMIAAANADHRVDEQERERILDMLEASGLGVEERRFMLAELESPSDVASLAGEARSPELARQIYLASLMAIEVDTEAEETYLRRLAVALGLGREQVTELEAMLDGEAE